MDKYMKKSDVIAYIRNEAKEAQSEFEELGGESGIIAEAFEDLANELEDFRHRRCACAAWAVAVQHRLLCLVLLRVWQKPD